MEKEEAVEVVKREIHRRAELLGFFVKDEDLSDIEDGGWLWVMARTVYWKNQFVYWIRCSSGHKFSVDSALGEYEFYIGHQECRCPVCQDSVFVYHKDEYPFYLCDIMGQLWPRENRSERVIYAEVYENNVLGRMNEAGEYRLYYKPPTIRIQIPALAFNLPLQPPYESIEKYAADYGIFHKE